MSKPNRYIDDMTSAGIMTAEELLREQPPHKRSELVAGRMIVREPAGHLHGRIANKLAFLLTKHVTEENLGVVFAAETGFVLRRDPDRRDVPSPRVRSEGLHGKGSSEP